MMKFSMRAISAAAATVAVLAFGMQAQAQTNVTPPGSSNSKDAVSPSPMGGTGATGRAGAEANNSSGTAKSATMTPGTSNPKDNVTPPGQLGRTR